jgi:hypothetical protein
MPIWIRYFLSLRIFASKTLLGLKVTMRRLLMVVSRRVRAWRMFRPRFTLTANRPKLCNLTPSPQTSVLRICPKKASTISPEDLVEIFSCEANLLTSAAFVRVIYKTLLRLIVGGSQLRSINRSPQLLPNTCRSQRAVDIIGSSDFLGSRQAEVVDDGRLGTINVCISASGCGSRRQQFKRGNGIGMNYLTMN